MRGLVAITAVQRIARLLLMVGLAVAAYLVLSLFDHAARADDGLPAPVGQADPLASVKQLTTAPAKVRTTTKIAERKAPKVLERKTSKVVEPKTRKLVERKTPKAVERKTPKVLERKIPKVVQRTAPKVLERKMPKVVEQKKLVVKPVIRTVRELTSSIPKAAPQPLPHLVLPATTPITPVPITPVPITPVPITAVPMTTAPITTVPIAAASTTTALTTTVPATTASPTPPSASELLASGVRCDLIEHTGARSGTPGLSRAPATPKPISPPTSPPRPGDHSTDGHLRDSGGGSASPAGTVPSSWWPEIPAAILPVPADASTSGRTVRYSGPPS